MKTNNTLKSFNDMPPSQAVIKNVIPAIIAMLMILIYNLADTFFIAQTNDAFQVAAVSLATPVFLIFMSVGTVFGIGGTSVISRAIGEGKLEYAKKTSSFVMWSCLATSIVISLLFLIFMDKLLFLIGASPETFDLAKNYLVIVSLGGPFVMFSTCFSNILRAEGQAKKAMVGQVLGNIINIVLDPIMILTLNLNITGAAIATVIGNLIAAGYYLHYFNSNNSSLSISIKDFTMKDRIPSSILLIGIPASLASVLMSVSQIIMNSLMAEYGDMALAGIGVAMKITMITGMVSMGIGQGIQPLLGFCVGAKNWSKFNAIMKFSTMLALFTSIVLTTLCYFSIDSIVGVFLENASAYEYAHTFSRILLTTSSLFGFFFVLSNALQAMGAASASLIINLSRQGLIYIPMLFVFNYTLGASGLVWAQPVADLLSTMLAATLFMLTYRKMLNLSDVELVNVPLG